MSDPGEVLKEYEDVISPAIYAAMYFEMAEEHGHPYASAKVQVCRQMLHAEE